MSKKECMICRVTDEVIIDDSHGHKGVNICLMCHDHGATREALMLCEVMLEQKKLNAKLDAALQAGTYPPGCISKKECPIMKDFLVRNDVIPPPRPKESAEEGVFSLRWTMARMKMLSEEPKAKQEKGAKKEEQGLEPKDIYCPIIEKGGAPRYCLRCCLS